MGIVFCVDELFDFIWKAVQCVLPGISIAKSGRSSMRGVVSVSLVSKLERPSATRCFIFPWWITLKLSSNKRSRHCASRLNLYNVFKIYIRESWSVRFLIGLPLWYGHNSRTAQTITKRIFCVASNLSSALLRKQEEWPTGSWYYPGAFGAGCSLFAGHWHRCQGSDPHLHWVVPALAPVSAKLWVFLMRTTLFDLVSRALQDGLSVVAHSVILLF